MAAVQNQWVNDRIENEFLIGSVRVGNHHTYPKINDSSERKIDWEYLIDQSARHGTRCLLYQFLKSQYPDRVPPGVMNRLRKHYHWNTGRSLFLVAQLQKILGEFRDEGIPAVPYKGPALAAFLYDSIALRESVDLDILVRKMDARRTKSLLLMKGFQPVIDMPPEREAKYIESQNSVPFIHPHRGIALDLHWGIIPRHYALPIQLEPMWNRLRSIRLGDENVLSFAPEDYLLLLCVHGGKHLWTRLCWIGDIARLIHRHRNMNWENLILQARHQGCERILLLGLFLAWDLLSAPLPGFLIEQIKNKGLINNLGREAYHHFRNGDPDESGDLRGILRKFLFDLKIKDRFSQRVRHVLRLAFTPGVADWEMFSFPPSLSFLHPIFRLIRLFYSYVFIRFSDRDHQVKRPVHHGVR